MNHLRRENVVPEVLSFLAGGGEAGDLIASRDWASSPLGPIAGWPGSLKTTVGLLLRSHVPIVLLWGPDGVMLYNDAYSVFAGGRHPQLLGSKVREGWPEVADFNDNVMRVGLSGGTLAYRDQELTLHRAGRPEQVWMNLDYSPVLDEAGQPAGVIAIVIETTERVAAERRVAADRERLVTLFEQAPSFMTMVRGPEHVFELANPGYMQLIGHREILGRSVAEALPEVAEQGYLDLLDNVYRSGQAYVAAGARYAVQADPGGPATNRYVDFVFQPILDSAGAVSGVFIQGVDVTTRRSAEARLVESEARYRSLFEAVDAGFCIIEMIHDAEGVPSDYRFVEVNPAFENQTGLRDAVGRRIRELVPTHESRWFEVYGRVAATGEPVRIEEGSAALDRWWDVHAFRIGEPGQNRVAVLFNDVSEWHRADIALREMNETLERRVAEALAERKILADLVENTDAFVQVADLDHRFLAVNRASADEFERIFGVRPRVGDSMLDLLADKPEHQAAVKAAWARALAGEEYTTVEEFGDAARVRRAYEIKFNVLRDATGRRIGAYQFVTDVTERLAEQRRLADTEEALRQSQKMEAVGQLTGGIAHDFNNLLTGITGSMELLTTRIAQGRIGDIERYVTAVSRRQTLDPKPTDVNRLVHDMAELIRRTVGPSVTVETVAMVGLWPTLVDPGQLENSLLNLCINARDAMPDGGRITIETANRWVDHKALGTHDLPPGQYVSMCVSDTGTGMSPDVVARAFEPFFTTKPIGQGTGLGLSMIYGFVRQSGGHVRIYSEVGHGAMVCLYLPRHHGAVDGADETSGFGEAPRAGVGETVLVVDDEPSVRMLVIETLEDMGYAAIEAADGPSGLTVLQSDTRIDLLVSDVGLPGGMNGRQMVDAARAKRPDLKVLFITGYAENAVVGNGHLDAGMHVMTKPFAMEALASRIKELITRR